MLTCTTTHVSAGSKSSAPRATRRGPPDLEDPLPPPPLPPPAAAAAAAASSSSLCLWCARGQAVIEPDVAPRLSGEHCDSCEFNPGVVGAPRKLNSLSLPLSLPWFKHSLSVLIYHLSSLTVGRLLMEPQLQGETCLAVNVATVRTSRRGEHPPPPPPATTTTTRRATTRGLSTAHTLTSWRATPPR